MAYVLCDMDALKDFQQTINDSVTDLQRELGSRDGLIDDTIRRIQVAIDRAIQREEQAKRELDQAEDRLREAERRTAELNRNREEGTEPAETPSFYYEDVEECRDTYDAVVSYRRMAESTLDEFTAYARHYKQCQEDGVEAYRRLAKSSDEFVDKYANLLVKAKQATVFGGNSGGKSASGMQAAAATGGDAAKSVMEAGQLWTKTLTPEQANAFQNYSGAAYSNINATLRGISPGFTGNNKECARQISRSLSACRIPNDCTVYRGVSTAFLGKYKGLSDSALVGKMLPDEGFMSTSLKQRDAFRDDILLVIDVPAGAPGAYIGYMSLFGHRESEVLFDRGQWLKVTSVSWDSDGRRVIHAKMLKS